MPNADLEFWLKKRGDYPFVTYTGGGMRAMLNIHIPADEVAQHYGVAKLQVGKLTYTQKEVKKP